MVVYDQYVFPQGGAQSDLFKLLECRSCGLYFHVYGIINGVVFTCPGCNTKHLYRDNNHFIYFSKSGGCYE